MQSDVAECSDPARGRGSCAVTDHGSQAQVKTIK